MPKAATALLRQDHAVILRMLDKAEEVGDKLALGEHVAPETLSALVEFFRCFADECHELKEDNLLFPLLEMKGLARECGPTGALRAEHAEGRGLVKELARAGADHLAGHPGAAQAWSRAARAYAQFLRQHIARENGVLLPIVERMLSDGEQEQLAQAFVELEKRKMGAGRRERLNALLDKLTAELPQTQA